MVSVGSGGTIVDRGCPLQSGLALFQYRSLVKRQKRGTKKKHSLSLSLSFYLITRWEKYSQRKLQCDKPSNAYTLKPVLHTRRRMHAHNNTRTREKSPRSFADRGIHLDLQSPIHCVWDYRELVSSRPRVAVSFFTGKPRRGYFNRRHDAHQPKGLLKPRVDI